MPDLLEFIFYLAAFLCFLLAAFMDEAAVGAYHASYSIANRTLDVHVATLRTKLGRADLVQTVRGVGYRFAASWGDKAAQMALGVAYFNGDGIPRDRAAMTSGISRLLIACTARRPTPGHRPGPRPARRAARRGRRRASSCSTGSIRNESAPAARASTRLASEILVADIAVDRNDL